MLHRDKLAMSTPFCDVILRNGQRGLWWKAVPRTFVRRIRPGLVAGRCFLRHDRAQPHLALADPGAKHFLTHDTCSCLAGASG